MFPLDEIPEDAHWPLYIARDLTSSTSRERTRGPFILWKRNRHAEFWADRSITTLTGYLRLQLSRSDLWMTVNSGSHDIVFQFAVDIENSTPDSRAPINFSLGCLCQRDQSLFEFVKSDVYPDVSVFSHSQVQFRDGPGGISIRLTTGLFIYWPLFGKVSSARGSSLHPAAACPWRGSGSRQACHQSRTQDLSSRRCHNFFLGR
jgi:hypothetical protein